MLGMQFGHHLKYGTAVTHVQIPFARPSPLNLCSIELILCSEATDTCIDCVSRARAPFFFERDVRRFVWNPEHLPESRPGAPSPTTICILSVGVCSCILHPNSMQSRASSCSSSILHPQDERKYEADARRRRRAHSVDSRQLHDPQGGPGSHVSPMRRTSSG